jgi:ABC-2 type transport system permease protein
VTGAWATLIRTGAFLRKETVEVARQPRLLLTLVLGPFLILFLFGAGLRDTDPPVRTVFVAPPESELTAEVVEFATAQSERLTVVGVVSEEDAALQQLRRGDLDLVVVFPADAGETVRNDEQATIRMYHTQLDPVEGRAIELFMQTAVDQVNRQVLAGVVGESQTETEDLHERVAAARQRTAAVRTAVDGDDGATADRQLGLLRGDLAELALVAGPALGVLASVDGTGSGEAPIDLAALQDRLAAIEGTSPGDTSGAGSEDLSALDELETDLAMLDEYLAEYRSLSPGVLVAPFRGEAVRLEGAGVELSDFYAPAVVIVLLQHLLVTFVGLSLVREVELGTTELYRVAPLRVGELLVGKYVAFLLIAAAIAAALIALLVVGLGVPVVGSWVWLVAIIAGVLFASAGYGFLVAVASRTDSQAVQYTMILLLLTIFFSGFLLSLERFIPAVRWVAWIVPATYGTNLLRDVMLQGQVQEPLLLAALFGMGAVLALVSWLLLRRRLSTR